METTRREILYMEIPALLHLSRLGYGYLSRKELRGRDRKTNLIPDSLRAALEKINPHPITGETVERLIADLREQLDSDDLGMRFYRTIRDGWNGLRLIDFAHPENNLFQSAAELACGHGAGSFRPDISLFVNGLPLAMIEVKTRDYPRTLQTEYDRLLDRSRSREGRTFLRAVQIWAFSDDHAADPDRLLPTEGAYYTTAMSEELILHPVREKRPGIYTGLRPGRPEEEKRILEDNGIGEKPRTRAFQRSLSPGKPTHRMLTTLFHPERFLFLLRYGIRYIREKDAEGRTVLTRRLLTTGELFALNALTEKARRGYRNWTFPSCGASGEKAANASLITLLQDLAPGAGLYWVSADERELTRDRETLEASGISCAPRGETAEGMVALITMEEAPEIRIREAGERPAAGRRIFILPQRIPQYGQKRDFTAGLRRMDADAILVTRTAGVRPEESETKSIGLFAACIQAPRQTGQETSTSHGEERIS